MPEAERVCGGKSLVCGASGEGIGGEAIKYTRRGGLAGKPARSGRRQIGLPDALTTSRKKVGADRIRG